MSFFVERNIRTERLEITMITVNAMGDTCPIPVVKTKNAIKELNGAGVVETLVDNEIAVQNLTKMANQKGYGVKSEKISDGQYKVTMEIGEEAAAGNTALSANDAAETEKEENCAPNAIHGSPQIIWVRAMKNLEKYLSKDLFMHSQSRMCCHRQYFFITEVQS